MLFIYVLSVRRPEKTLHYVQSVPLSCLWIVFEFRSVSLDLNVYILQSDDGKEPRATTSKTLLPSLALVCFNLLL